MTVTLRRVRTVLLAAVALAITAAASAFATNAVTSDTRAAQQPVVRTALAAAVDPPGAAGYTLGLSRVTVDPGGVLPLHRHPGTQIAYLQRGVLTYTVETGSVEVRRGSPEGVSRRVRTIRAGQTGRIPAGTWIVERPGTIHHAANKGDTRIVILISSLFRDGQPPAIPVASRDEG